MGSTLALARYRRAVLLVIALLMFGCDGSKPRSASSIKTFSFSPMRNPVLTADVTAAIVGTAISATVPFGTDLTGLIPTFSTAAAHVTIDGAAQISGLTANDFRRPLTYRVVAPNGSTREYTVTVTPALDPDKALTSFEFLTADNPGLTTDAAADLIGTAVTVTVPYGTPVTALVASFTSRGTSVSVGDAVQTSGATPNDFTRPVVYRVTAMDGSTASYTVTVEVESGALKEISGMSFFPELNPGLAIDAHARIAGTTIVVNVPVGTPVDALVATFAITGASVTVDGIEQISSVTANDFTNPVVYQVVALDGSTQAYTVTVATRVQQSYVKASNTGVGAFFGTSVALSADGTTFAVGAPSEGGNPFRSGAVYVFTRAGGTWVEEARLVASNATTFDSFGVSVALSADGSTLAVGAYLEDSAATGVGGDQTNDDGTDSGAAYIFTRAGASWTQQAYVKSSNSDAGDLFGRSVALSADGSTLAVGASLEDSAARGVNGEQSDTSSTRADSGAVYVFTRAGATWSQQAYIKASNTDEGDQFGVSVALAADGSTLAVGAVSEGSAATGVGGNQASNTAESSGAVYVLTRAGATWRQQAYVKASNTGVADAFGASVALAADGATLAVGASGESSAATGVGGDQSDDSAQASGAAYVFTRAGTTWAQRAYLKATNTDELDFFGQTIALSADGATLAVGAPFEASAATGVAGDQADNSLYACGAVYVFALAGPTWAPQAYVKASNPDTIDEFGTSVSLSGDGATLAAGAPSENSAATGVDGDQTNDNAPSSGAVYVFD